MLAGALVSCFAPYAIDASSPIDLFGADQSVNFALGLALSYFWAFAFGFALGVQPLNRATDSPLRRAACALGLCFALLFLEVASVSRFLDEHVADWFQLGHQSERLLAAYGVAYEWVPRLTAVVVSSLLVILTLGWLPRTEEWFTLAGSRSMYPYVFQMTGITVFSKLIDFTPQVDPGSLVRQACVLAVLAPLLVQLMSSLFMRFIFWPLLEPTWLHALLPQRWAELRRGRLEVLAPSGMGFGSTALVLGVRVHHAALGAALLGLLLFVLLCFHVLHVATPTSAAGCTAAVLCIASMVEAIWPWLATRGKHPEPDAASSPVKPRA